MRQLINGLTQGYVNPTHIERYYPNGCFIYHFEWDPKKIRCSRNVLPAFVKPINTQNGPLGASCKIVCIHRANGRHVSAVPYQGYYIAETFEEALKEYRKLLESAYKARKEYLEQSLKDFDTNYQIALRKIDNHIFK